MITTLELYRRGVKSKPGCVPEMSVTEGDLSVVVSSDLLHDWACLRPPSSSDRRLRASAFNRWAGAPFKVPMPNAGLPHCWLLQLWAFAAFKYRWLYRDRVSGEIDIETAPELLTAVQRRDCRSRCPCGLALGRCSWTLLKSRSSARPEQRSSSRGGATVSFAMPATGCLVHPKTVATIRVA